MFTPPPSPSPPRSHHPRGGQQRPSPLPTHEPDEYPFPDLTSSLTAESAESAESEKTQSKRRTGRRTLWLALLVPALFLLFASSRHPRSLSFSSSSLPLHLTKRANNSTAPTPTTSSSDALPTVPSSAVLPTPFPQPFDGSTLSASFTTQGCEAFFLNFTQQLPFRQCRAVSFLLNASAEFLADQTNHTLLATELWGTCNTPEPFDTCTALMSSLLDTLNDACALDIQANNQAALQAQVGFQSYAAMRTALCLENAATNTYCYLEAAAASPPADVYFYALPFGSPLPPNINPSCSPCLKQTLGVFAEYVDPSAGGGTSSVSGISGNSTQAVQEGGGQQPTLPVLSKTYPAAAKFAVDKCGGTYASVGATQNAAPRNLPLHTLSTLVLVGMWAWWFSS